MAGKTRARNSDDATRAAQKANASEATALGTTAAAMVLGVVAGDAAGHAAKEASPAMPVAHGGGQAETAPDASPFHFAPFSSAARAAAEPGSNAGESTALPDTPHDQATDMGTGALAVEGTATSAAITSAPAASADDMAGSAVTTPATPMTSGSHSAPVAQEGGFSLSAAMEHSLDSVTARVDGFLNQLPNIEVPTLPEMPALTDSIATTASQITQSVLSAPSALAGSLVTGLFDDSGQHGSPGGAGGLDTAPLVPVSMMPTPLNLGFTGQPQVDGPDGHDGAFSALGLHHF